MDCFIARQPIFDIDNDVVAYELLFRTGIQNAFPGVDGDIATANVMMDNFILNNILSLTQGKKAFINFPEKLLLEGYASYLPKEHVVIEILEDIPAHQEAIEACRKLQEDGYIVALDDFVLDPNNANAPLIDHCDIIKVDYMLTTPGERLKIMEQLAGKEVMLLAEKIETQEEYEEAIKEGFSFFQGYFFAKPEIIQGRRIPENKLSKLELIKAINSPDPQFDEIADVVKRDVSLTYKLLRCINSAAFGLTQEIESIQQAVVYLGFAHLRKWITFIVLAELSDDKSPELLRNALVRARFSEMLVPLTGIGKSEDDLFLMGLFSLADAMLDKSMQEVLEEIPLPSDVKETLLGREHEYGYIMDFVKAYEAGHWDVTDEICQDLDIDSDQLFKAYNDTIKWVNEVVITTQLGKKKTAA